jgi:hypothetical protein
MVLLKSEAATPCDMETGRFLAHVSSLMRSQPGTSFIFITLQFWSMEDGIPLQIEAKRVSSAKCAQLHSSAGIIAHAIIRA